MPQTITVRAGDTEPLDITIGATGLSDLTSLDTAVLHLRKDGAATNHVDGAALVVPDEDGLVVRFDPLDAKVGGGNALDTPGRYRGYVLATWTDGDETRHPADSELVVVVRGTLE